MKKKEKEQLPDVLFLNSKKDKRGKGDLTKSLHIRITVGDHSKIKDLVKKIGCTQSNLLRYCLNVGVVELEGRVLELEQIAKDEKEG